MREREGEMEMNWKSVREEKLRHGNEKEIKEIRVGVEERERERNKRD
jgi:hypothetical protein